MTLDKARVVHQEIGRGKTPLEVANELGIKYKHAWQIFRGKIWKDASPFASQLTGR